MNHPAAVILVVLAGALPGAAETGPGLVPVQLTLVDDQAIGYATFQSLNQKVVANNNGIFMTHLRRRNANYTAQQWRLSQSTDGGLRFSTIYEATDPTNPPVLETDEQDNLYLARPELRGGQGWIYLFRADKSYQDPRRVMFPRAAGDKYSFLRDGPRERFYYVSNSRILHAINPDGTLAFERELFNRGQTAYMEYPHLALDQRGGLHLGWTTQKRGVYLYWDIHTMSSDDGGQTWRTLGGKPIDLPADPDHHGITQRVTRDDEFDTASFLASMIALDGKLHMFYLAQTKPQFREHYLRLDLGTGERDVDLWPAFGGQRISFVNLDGFFVAGSEREHPTLYCVSNWRDHIACIASDDNGRSWYDYAVSNETMPTYAIGGCRTVTADGHIIGSFTSCPGRANALEPTSKVYFFKIKAGVCSVLDARAKFEDGVVSVDFSGVRGKPVQIRFRNQAGAWSDWGEYENPLHARIPVLPTHFQLKSGMGTESSVFPLRPAQR